MAENKSWLGKVQGSGAEARERAKIDLKQRTEAAKKTDSRILNQNDLNKGVWDSLKVLQTSLGGEIRAITADDLAIFRQNIKTAEAKFKSSKGVTAKQIIDWSTTGVGYWSYKEGKFKTLKSDLALANEQIKMAVPVSAFGGKVRFITNAGPDSDVTRHHVTIEFMNYGPEAASGVNDPRKSAMRVRKGPLKIECDCGKFRFWYRYVATIGGFNAGREETGFPKIRNPKLAGIACKHIVRVAAEIEKGGSVLPFLTKLMEKAKASDINVSKTQVRTVQKEAEKLIKNQERRKTGGEIKTSEQKREANATKNAAKNATKPVKPKRASKAAQTPQDAAAILAKSGLSMEQIMQLIKQAG